MPVDSRNKSVAQVPLLSRSMPAKLSVLLLNIEYSAINLRYYHNANDSVPTTMLMTPALPHFNDRDTTTMLMTQTQPQC